VVKVLWDLTYRIQIASPIAEIVDATTGWWYISIDSSLAHLPGNCQPSTPESNIGISNTGVTPQPGITECVMYILGSATSRNFP